jgi:hypothetical protein
MITLTTPAQINSVLGGNAPVGYNHLVLSPITMSPFDRTLSGALRLTSTTNPEMPVIQGSLSILLGPATMEVRVEQLDFYRKLTLSAPQIAAVQGWINTAQNNIEAGLVGVGVIQGVQSTGA